MPTYLQALGLKNYRGVGPDWQMMPEFRDFNFFIGANNTGKSTVLNFISKWLGLDGSDRPPLGPAEIYLHGLKGQPEFAIGRPVEEVIEIIVAKLPEHVRDRLGNGVRRIAEAMSFRDKIWLKYDFTRRESATLFTEKEPKLEDLLDHQALNEIWSLLTGRSGGALRPHWIPETLKTFTDAAIYGLPRTLLIPAIRAIGPKGGNFVDFGGSGLIDRLAEMQSPDMDKRQERELFDRINVFLQSVTGYGEAYIEIPHNRDHILVHVDGKVLPLWALGTGIQEVILIAAYCTINQQMIACIEEPELHLHPLLQRKLLTYLRENTQNQYFIATHSAAFIDTPGAAIFHVRAEEGQTLIGETILRSKRFEICEDLGYRASDLVQANAVVWCEGPSDRVYLNHWISALDPQLVEGVHYSIMFYGGRNLSHLTAEDDDVKAFISLRALNRHCAILIDSDRATAEGPINETKARICAEFAKGRGVAWVTAGREIENYLDFTRLQKAILEVHPRSYGKPANSGGRFEHALLFRPVDATKARPKPITADKVKVAKAMVSVPPDFDILDLRERVVEVVEMIQSANA